MKTTKLLGQFNRGSLYHIISEPGDATRYDYIVLFDEHHIFSFMPTYENSFRYPQTIDFYQITFFEENELKGKPNERIALLAKEKNCNPFTLMECLRTIIQIKEGTI